MLYKIISNLIKTIIKQYIKYYLILTHKQIKLIQLFILGYFYGLFYCKLQNYFGLNKYMKNMLSYKLIHFINNI